MRDQFYDGNVKTERGEGADEIFKNIYFLLNLMVHYI